MSPKLKRLRVRVSRHGYALFTANNALLIATRPGAGTVEIVGFVADADKPLVRSVRAAIAAPGRHVKVASRTKPDADPILIRKIADGDQVVPRLVTRLMALTERLDDVETRLALLEAARLG